MTDSRRTSARRKIAVATWRPSRDGRIFARMAVDATASLEYCEKMRAEHGVPVSITHVVGVALARAMATVPETLARVVAGRVVPYPGLDIGFAVDVEVGRDLAPAVVRGVDALGPVEVARQLEVAAGRFRASQDRGYRFSSRLVDNAPLPLHRAMLAVASFVTGGLGKPALGQQGFPLGNAFVSNVGTLGLDEAFVAPVPFARVPVYMAIGMIRDAPMVVDGAVVVRPQVVVTATADHRLVDGAQAGRLAQHVRASLLDPWSLEP